MSEYTEDVLDGTICQECGAFIGPQVGHPRSCDLCKPKRRKP